MHNTSPGKRSFYKYLTPDTTLAILETQSVRYSSPLAFNDPFDIQAGLHFEFDLSGLHEKTIDRIHTLAAAPSAPNVDSNDVWGQLVLKIREYFPTHGFNRQHLIKLTAPPFVELNRTIAVTQEQYQAHWREKLLPSIRVFCVCEECDNLLMWSHYAKDHTGAVLELWSLPEEDNLLSIARPIDYNSSPFPFFTEAEWIDDLTGIKKLDFDALHQKYAYAKSELWKYEKEWRVWYPNSNSNKLFDTVPLRQSEVASIYFGCNADSDFIRKSLEQCRISFPNVTAFQAHKSSTSYALEFTEI